MKKLSLATLSLFLLFSPLTYAGLITGEFSGYITNLSDVGDTERYQNEYYNSNSYFNGQVDIGEEVSGFFTYNNALAPQDSRLNDPHYSNHHSTDDDADWLSLSFVIGGETFTISTNPTHVDADTIYRQDTVVITDKNALEGSRRSDSFHAQEDNHHEQSMFVDGSELQRRNKKYGYINVWDVNQNFINSDSLIQDFDISAELDKNIGSAYFLYQNNQYSNASGSYDYYEQFSANMNITSLSVSAQSISVAEPSMLFLFIFSALLVFFREIRRKA